MIVELKDIYCGLGVYPGKKGQAIVSKSYRNNHLKTSFAEIVGMINNPPEVIPAKAELNYILSSGYIKKGTNGVAVDVLHRHGQYNSVVQIDIDDIEPYNVSKYFEIIKTYEYVFMCGVSPSGRGLKAFILTDLEKNECRNDFVNIHKIAVQNIYLEIQELFKRNEVKIEIQKDGKGEHLDTCCYRVAQVCFLFYGSHFSRSAIVKEVKEKTLVEYKRLTEINRKKFGDKMNQAQLKAIKEFEKRYNEEQTIDDKLCEYAFNIKAKESGERVGAHASAIKYYVMTNAFGVDPDDAYSWLTDNNKNPEHGIEKASKLYNSFTRYELGEFRNETIDKLLTVTNEAKERKELEKKKPFMEAYTEAFESIKGLPQNEKYNALFNEMAKYDKDLLLNGLKVLQAEKDFLEGKLKNIKTPSIKLYRDVNKASDYLSIIETKNELNEGTISKKYFNIPRKCSDLEGYIKVKDNYYQMIPVPNPEGKKYLKDKLTPEKVNKGAVATKINNFYNLTQSVSIEDFDDTFKGVMKIEPNFNRFNSESEASINEYKGFINHPNNLDYHQVIDGRYNTYSAIPQKPTDSYVDINDIKRFISVMKHIFGDQLDMGLDYLKALVIEPMVNLPILCLVSEKRGTGKSSFLNIMELLFGANAVEIRNDDLQSRFNSWWTSSLLVMCDETDAHDKKITERLKGLATSKGKVAVESKGVDVENRDFFGKFILCSNNTKNFVYTDEKEVRFWVRDIDELPEEMRIGTDFFLSEIEKEVPSILKFLIDRSYEKRDIKARLFFNDNDLNTKATDKLKKHGNSDDVKMLGEVLGDLFLEKSIKDDSEWCFNKSEIILALKDIGATAMNPKRIGYIMDNVFDTKYQAHRMKSFEGEVVKKGYKLSPNYVNSVTDRYLD